MLSLGCKDMMYIKQLIAEIRPAHPPGRVKAYTDNTAAIDIVKAYSVSARTKHFERWIGYVRDLYQRSVIELSHLSTDQMPADIFTKALPVDPFIRFRHFLLGMP